jgi:hypothetical protein
MDGKLRKGSDLPSCSKCSTRLDAGRDGSHYHRVASICFWTAANERIPIHDSKSVAFRYEIIEDLN